jgi:hypothetical protein
MRLHTDYPAGARALLREAYAAATTPVRGAPRMSALVGFVDVPTVHGSRSHREAIEFGLYYASAKLPGDGRRWKNTGGRGASDLLAATYDEHGIFLAEVFALDASARLAGAYDGRDDFNRKTRNAYWLDMSAGPTIASTNNMHS